MANWENDVGVINFREYLRIPSVHPDIDYAPCVTFLEKMAESLGLPARVHEVYPGKPVVIITRVGTNPQLPSVFLNSHMDVVPVFEESWTYPPFGAHMDESGKIFARGAQDMKCVGIQYIEALRGLKQEGVRLKRTIHVSFVPDEEIGGTLGMVLFVETLEFKQLNVGVGLDEGMATADDAFPLFNGERSAWQMRIHCPGTTGHGSLLLPNTAGEKMRIMLDRFMDYRESQVQMLENNPELMDGDVTSVNLTKLMGGVQSNVVPEILTAVFDCRLAVTVNHDEFEQMLERWCKEAGEGVEIEFEKKAIFVEPTVLDDTNKYWIAYKKAADEIGISLKPQIFTAATDSKNLRKLGIPVFGFSPMNKTPVLLHAHDEYLSADIYLRGIEIFKKIIHGVANVD